MKAMREAVDNDIYIAKKEYFKMILRKLLVPEFQWNIRGEKIFFYKEHANEKGISIWRAFISKLNSQRLRKMKLPRLVTIDMLEFLPVVFQQFDEF